ncbi:MAG TPA: T9SS type A sorting domain-containing protein [Bacteroidia bacterium]|jgi:hypothetical protein
MIRKPFSSFLLLYGIAFSTASLAAEESFTATALYASNASFQGDTVGLAAFTDGPVHYLDGVSIYPNFAGEQFFVEIKAKGPSIIEVFNAAGILLAREEVEQGTTTIDMRNNKNGVYFVKVTKGKAMNLKRIILQR